MMNEYLIVAVAIIIFLAHSKFIKIERETILEKRKKERRRKFYTSDFTIQDKYYGIMLGQMISTPDKEKTQNIADNMKEQSKDTKGSKDTKSSKDPRGPKNYNISNLDLKQLMQFCQSNQDHSYDSKKDTKEII